MSKITAITPQIKNKDRVNIFIDDEFICGLQLETVAKNRLKVGNETNKESLIKLMQESEKSVALNKAMGFISKSIKTKKGVREYLSKKGFDEDCIEYVMNKLEEYKYVDDGIYATSYVNTYSRSKGSRLIAMELKSKGVSSEEIENALENIGDELQTATAIAEKYLKNKERDFKNIQKAYKYLLSKGFSYEIAKKAVKADTCEDY